MAYRPNPPNFRNAKSMTYTDTPASSARLPQIFAECLVPLKGDVNLRIKGEDGWTHSPHTEVARPALEARPATSAHAGRGQRHSGTNMITTNHPATSNDVPETGEIDEWLEQTQIRDSAEPVVKMPKLVYNPNEPTKRCRQCARRKPVSQFTRQPRSRDGYGHYCNLCLSLLPG